jgi:hypothetical protein
MEVATVAEEEKSETNWYEWLKSAHPFYQTLFRALQSVCSRAANGADIRVARGKTDRYEYVTVVARRMELTVEYDTAKKLLKVIWETKREGLNFKEWRIKRSNIDVPDEKVARELLDYLEDVMYTAARTGHTADDLYTLLRPYAEQTKASS